MTKDTDIHVHPKEVIERILSMELVRVTERAGMWHEQPGLVDVLVLQHHQLQASRLCIHNLGSAFERVKAAVEAEVQAVRYWPAACLPDTDAQQFKAALQEALWARMWRPIHVVTSGRAPNAAAHQHNDLRYLFLCDAWGSRLAPDGDAPVVALWEALKRSGVTQTGADATAAAMAALLAASAGCQAARVLLLATPFNAPDAGAVVKAADGLAASLNADASTARDASR